MAKDLQYYYAQLRRIEEHREKSTEKEIRKVYKTMLTDLQHFISDEYVKLAEDGQLTYEILRGKNEYARFLDEVEKRLNGISPKVSKEIRATVNEMYKLSYDGMVDAVSKSTSSDTLRAAFKGVKGATPETIKAAVENPIAGLTLNDTLEKNRRDIIYNIKKQIGIGLTSGDRMSTMARRIADSLDGDYKKAVRVARTEVHRVRETGHNDCVEEIDQTLQNGTTSLRMVKIWRTMKDERVRPQQRVKTKHGWKTVIRGNADHMKMEGQTVLADELFDLGGGLKAKAPGQSGDASNDINCRCTVEYVLMSDEEYFKATGKHFAVAKNEQIAKEAETPDYWDADKFAEIEKQMNPEEEELRKSVADEILRDLGIDIRKPGYMDEHKYDYMDVRGQDWVKEDRFVKDDGTMQLMDIVNAYTDKYMNPYKTMYGSSAYGGGIYNRGLYYVQNAEGSQVINKYLRTGNVPTMRRKVTEQTFSHGKMVKRSKLKDVPIYEEGTLKTAIKDMDGLILNHTLKEDMVLDRWAGEDFLKDCLHLDISALTSKEELYGGQSRFGGAYLSQIDTKAAADEINKKLLGSTITDSAFMSASAVPENNIFIGSTVRIKVITPKGTHAFVTKNEMESEVVLGRNTKLEIVGAKAEKATATDMFSGGHLETNVVEITTRIING